MVIDGRLTRLRTVVASDEPRLREILSAPAVRRWWGAPERALADALAPPSAQLAAFAIEQKARGGADAADAPAVVGLIQWWEEDEPDFRHAGIDIAVDPAVHGRGIGSDAIAALAAHLFDVRGHHRLTIDPAAANEAAIRVYRRLGFREVGIMRRYWRDPHGVWQDGLLLDLLAGELVTPAH
jgi:aminoglycoside 6'-N-acetyltransferase